MTGDFFPALFFLLWSSLCTGGSGAVTTEKKLKHLHNIFFVFGFVYKVKLALCWLLGELCDCLSRVIVCQLCLLSLLWLFTPLCVSNSLWQFFCTTSCSLCPSESRYPCFSWLLQALQSRCRNLVILVFHGCCKHFNPDAAFQLLWIVSSVCLLPAAGAVFVFVVTQLARDGVKPLIHDPVESIMNRFFSSCSCVCVWLRRMRLASKHWKGEKGKVWLG